jgi:hypothetical protein
LESLLKTIQNKYETQLGIKFSDFPNVIPSINNQDSTNDPLGIF